MTKYRQTEITKTNATCLNNGRKLFAITGQVEKSAETAPFLTTLQAAKRFVDQEIELRNIS